MLSEKILVRDFIVQQYKSRQSLWQYLTSSKKQAASFLRTSILKAANAKMIDRTQNYGYISTYQFHLAPELSCLLFADADREWLHCVAAHRKRNAFIETEKAMTNYDIIAGKIADDATNLVLNSYISGLYGKIGEKKTDALCIAQLLPQRLENQYCLRSDKALKCLEFIKGEKVWLNRQ